MSDKKQFCQFCEAPTEHEDIFCSECGQMISGERALSGPVEFHLTVEQIIGIVAALFIALNIVNFILLVVIPSEIVGAGIWFLLIPFIVGIIGLGIFGIIEFGDEGTTSWVGKQLNPYKKMGWGERIGELIGGLFSLIAIAVILYIIVDGNIPLFTRTDFWLIIALISPPIIDFVKGVMKFTMGNAPEQRPVFAASNVFWIAALAYFLMDWPFNIPGFITWLEDLVTFEFISSWISLNTVDQWIQIFTRFAIVFLVLSMVWHITIFIIWLDVRFETFGGRLGSVVPAEEEGSS